MNLQEQAPKEQQRIETDPRNAAINAKLYCFLLDRVAEKAEGYATQTQRESQETYIDTYQRSKIGIEDTLFSITGQETLPEFYGQETESFRRLALEVTNEVNEKKELLKNNPENFNTRQRLLLALRLQIRQRSMSEQQRSRLYEATGYSHAEATIIAKRLGKSLALTAATSAVFTPATIGAVALSKANPFLNNDITSKESLLAVGATYALHYGAVLKNGNSNRDLLHSDDIGTSPNVYATSLYYLLRKLAPDHKKMQDAAIIAGSLAPTAVPEAIFLPTLLTATTGPSIIVGRNVLGVGLNLAQAKINEVWKNRVEKKV